MTKLSDRMYVLAESETLAMSKKSAELKAQGLDIINLSIGEPDFNTPDVIKTGAKKAIDDNFTHYTPVAGYKDLREAIAKKLKRENNLDYAFDQIVVSTGAKHSIANTMLCLVNPGEEVIVPSPYWVSYREIVKLAEGKSVFIKTSLENDFKITAKQLEAAITPKTKLMIFSSPSNPTGFIYTKEELKAIAEVVAKHENLYIISDEIYEHINYVGKHESIAQFDFIKDRVILVNGVSKGYAMTGWRIGYVAAPKWVAQGIEKLQGQFTSGTCSIAQRAALTALTGDQSAVGEMREKFRKRRDLVVNLIKEIPTIKTNTPQGAFYVFADFSHYFGKSDGTTKIKDANDLTFWLLEKAQVAMVSGDAFGDPNCIRLSYATSDELLVKAIQRIKEALGKLK
ncbi:MAG: pyridoxal phosphate-dependent aminotransferase [Bacteroidales bacterium]|nr:pyridoxal phosphate-dependent aminotransferase [Bacteroidales bacterium]